MSAINASRTTSIDAEHEAVLGSYVHSLVKSRILTIILGNDYPAEYADFVYTIVCSRWDEKIAGQNESETSSTDARRECILRECTVELCGEMIPRLVAVQYAQDYSKAPLHGNMYLPVGYFQQKGMVIDLETGEILNPGMSWITTVDSLQTLDDIYTDVHYSPTVQVPMEGATVSMFLDPRDGQVYFGTGHRVLALGMIFTHNRGSRWNFFGPGGTYPSGGIFSIGQTSGRVNIHGAALECVVNSCLQYVDAERLPENPDQIEDLIREVVFRDRENLVVVGIVSGKPFAGQSQTMSEKDLEFTRFTPTSYLFRQTAGKTTWTEDIPAWIVEDLDTIFHPFSIDIRKFMVGDLSPSGYALSPSSKDAGRWKIGETPAEDFPNDKEDVLVIQEIRENGSRGVYRYCSKQTSFRESVLRGAENELEEIKAFFPKHRARVNPTPANIHERVHQVITLTIVGKGLYPFMTIDLLGSEGAKQLGNLVSREVGKLCGKHLYDHWKDIAFPISYFSIPSSEVDSTVIPRMLESKTNRALCNSLTVLYACASETLRERIVQIIAAYFHDRAVIAATAFLPPHAYEKIEERYMQAVPLADTNTRLPTGIHKLRMLRNLSASSKSNSSRKYKIAGLLSGKTLLDVSFMSAIINV